MKKLATVLSIIILTITLCSTSVFAAPNIVVNNTVYNQTPLYGAENYQYVTVQNTGSSAASNVNVTNTVSSAFNVIEWWVSWDNQATYIKNDSSYNPTTGKWTIGNLNSGQSVFLDIRMLISSQSSTTSTATATATGVTPVSKSFTVTPTTSSSTADLELTSEFGSTNPSPGSSNTLTITVSRPYLTTANGIIVNDGMPTNLDITSWRVRSQNWLTGWGSWTNSPTSYDWWTGIWQVTLNLWSDVAQQLEITYTTPTTAGTTQVISTVYGNQRDTDLTNNYNAAYFTVTSALNTLSLSQFSAFSATELDSGTSGLSTTSGSTGSGLNAATGSGTLGSGTSGSGISTNIPNSLFSNAGSETTGITDIMSNILNILLSTVSALLSNMLATLF